MVKEEKMNDDEDEGDSYWLNAVSDNIRRLDWKINQGEMI